MSETPPIRSLDELRSHLGDLPGPDEDAIAAVRRREPQLTKPPGSLGRLEEITEWLAAWQGRHPPQLAQVRAAVFAGNHGVADQGVSAFPKEVTAQMVANFQTGGAAVNQLCSEANVGLTVFELALEMPTTDFTTGPAMDDTGCLQSMVFGMSSLQDPADLICLGEMGIGNTTAAAAICHALYGGKAEDWTGPGTGVAGSALENKIRVVREGVEKNRAAMTDGLEVLRCVGGRELAAIAGAILAARWQRCPVLIDGFICTAAAATLHAMNPNALDHCIIAHASAEPGHAMLVERLGKKPMLDLGLRLGEASGAVLAVQLVRSALACHTGMATFAEAGVADKE
jgi:nicotinate-nucleotide--dimethylbenzimidazole phosphoribosyltransferase